MDPVRRILADLVLHVAVESAAHADSHSSEHRTILSSFHDIVTIVTDSWH